MGSARIDKFVDFSTQVFDLSDCSQRHKGWLWWFWLFFIENPRDPGKPRQLMILWSVKDVKKISCNGESFTFEKQKWVGDMDGVVAAWYFDGGKMHHNLLLEQCTLEMKNDELRSNSKTPTSFQSAGEAQTVKIGDRFRFDMITTDHHDFNKPTYVKDHIWSDFSYGLLRQNKFELSAVIDGEKLGGTAYFQRVLVNAPIPPWFWGVFHFENGGYLTYYQPHLLGQELRGDICIKDGDFFHEFNKVHIQRVEGEYPTFKVSGQDGDLEIAFDVISYSHSSWTFKSRPMGLIPTKLVYNEYPAVIENLTLTKAGKELINQKTLGKGVGNAEHATGLLL